MSSTTSGTVGGLIGRGRKIPEPPSIALFHFQGSGTPVRQDPRGRARGRSEEFEQGQKSPRGAGPGRSLSRRAMASCHALLCGAAGRSLSYGRRQRRPSRLANAVDSVVTQAPSRHRHDALHRQAGIETRPWSPSGATTHPAPTATTTRPTTTQDHDGASAPSDTIYGASVAMKSSFVLYEGYASSLA